MKANTNSLNQRERVLLPSESARSLYFRGPQSMPAEDRSALADRVLSWLEEGLKEVSYGRNGFETDYLILQGVGLDILLNQKRWDQASQALRVAWPLVVSNIQDIMPWTDRWVQIYQGQGHPQQTVPMLVKTIQDRLSERQRIDLNLCRLVSDVLLAQGQPKEALPWAKLVFLVCNCRVPLQTER